MNLTDYSMLHYVEHTLFICIFLKVLDMSAFHNT